MDASKNIRLLVSIGNPDPQYENTYHNVGHNFADYFESQEVSKSAIVKKSDRYMNESGAFVKGVLEKLKHNPGELIVAHDDSDLLIGEYKVSFNRGSGGHRGVQNIIDVIKTKEFWRLRIGVRPPSATGENRLKAEFFVLRPITAEESKIIEDTFARATRALSELLPHKSKK